MELNEKYCPFSGLQSLRLESACMAWKKFKDHDTLEEGYFCELIGR